jgi:hypothetical protein
MVMDGVLERHPTLCGGVIELGAGWVPSMLTRLDWTVDIWKRSEPELAAQSRKPSQQIIDQLAFTPFVYENVGELIRQASPAQSPRSRSRGIELFRATSLAPKSSSSATLAPSFALSRRRFASW